MYTFTYAQRILKFLVSDFKDYKRYTITHVISYNSCSQSPKHNRKGNRRPIPEGAGLQRYQYTLVKIVKYRHYYYCNIDVELQNFAKC